MMVDRQQWVAHWRGGSSCNQGRPSLGQSTHRRRRRSPVCDISPLGFTRKLACFTHLDKHLVALKVPRLAKEPGCVHVQTPRCPVALLIKSPDLYSPSQCASVSSRDFISWKWLWSDDVEYEDLEVTTESSITSVNPIKVPFQHVVHLHIFMLYTCTFLCPTPEIFMLYTRNFYVIQPRCFLATKIEFPIWMSIRHKYKYTFLVLWYGCSFDQLEFAPQINRNLTCFGSSGPYSSCGILKSACIKKRQKM